MIAVPRDEFDCSNSQRLVIVLLTATNVNLSLSAPYKGCMYDTIKELHHKELQQAVYAGMMDERKKIKNIIKRFFKENLDKEDVRGVLLKIAKEVNIE